MGFSRQEYWSGVIGSIIIDQVPLGASSVALMVKSLPARQENWVRSLSQEDPLEKEIAIHSSILAWKIPWTEEPGRLQSIGSGKSGTRLSDFTFTFHFHALEKEMAAHSCILGWRIPGMGEPGVLPSRESQSWTRLK